MPLVSVPFERGGINIVGPLVQATSRHQLLLVLIDYATRYPEFTCIGIPKQVVSDHGTSFRSEVL